MATLPGKPVDVPVDAPRRLSVEEVQKLTGDLGLPTIAPPAPTAPVEPSAPVEEDTNAPTSLSKEEVDARIVLELDPWEEGAIQPGVGSRMWGQLTGMDRPPDEYNLERMGTTTAGAIAGATLGTRVPIAPGPAGLLINPITGTLLFGGLGAFGGTYAPETTMEIMEFFGVLPEGYRDKHGLSPSRLQYEAENEALLDIATGGTFTVAKQAWKASSLLVTGAGKKSRELAKTASEKFDIDLMPVHVGKRAVAKMFVNVMGRFPFIGTRIRKVGGEAEQKLAKAYHELGENAFKGADDRVGVLVAANKISQLIFKDARNLMDDFNKTFKEMYDKAWKQADEIGIIVRPNELKTVADEVLATLNKKATITKEGVIIDGPVLEKVRLFVKNNVDALEDTQTLHQMDGFIGQVDQMLSELLPHQMKFADTQMLRLRAAAMKDVEINAIGEGAAEVTAKLKLIDQQFSHTLHSLFESATARNIEIVKRGGLRQSASLSKEATRMNIDQLAKVMVKIDSPQSITELSRLVSKETFQSIVAKTLDDAVQSAKKVSKDGLEEFHPMAFAGYLGLDPKTISSRTESLTTMLRLSGSSLTVKDLTDLIEITKTIAALPLPNANVFLQRKAVIGGLTGAIRGALPGLAATAGSGVVAGVWGMAIMIGGGKLASRLITDTKALKPFRKILHDEAKSIRNWKLIPQTIRASITALFGEGGITEDERDQMMEMVTPMVESFKREWDEQQIYPLYPLLKREE